ncbi:MAG: Nif3-like dinuclear metal center hexameric protein [Clostridia bacterium]|nr:Nif3-like dinuclear metal center hexameric protein [Clostridia bacterium]
MITVNDLYTIINEYAPFCLAEEWDNVGILVGRGDKVIKKLLVTLDVDEYVVKEAQNLGCDAILSHHPLMFRGIKHLTDSTPDERTLRALVISDISLVSAHTNLDSVRGGLNDFLSDKLEMLNTKIIEPKGRYNSVEYGFGRIGNLKNSVTFSEMLKKVCEILNINAVRYTGDLNRKISKIAVNCGGGADIMYECISLGADLFLTGDVKYNPFRDANDSQMAIIDAGHYETEYVVSELFKNLINEKCPDIEVLCSKENKPVVKYYFK